MKASKPDSGSSLASIVSGRPMARWAACLFAAAMLLGSAAAGAIAPMDFDSPEQRERFKALTEELRCLVCQNQSLADSDAGLAQDMRREVLAMIKAGRTDEEIRGFLVERYGEFVLYKPTVGPSTWLLWFGPGLLVVTGLGALLIALKRRSRQSAPPDNELNQ